MNYELFLAKRLTDASQHKNTISSPIIKIAILAIALGIIIMMVTIASVIGLQEKIRDKITGFNGHVQITNFDNNNSEITLVPISTKQDFYPTFSNVDGVTSVRPYATKAGIIRTENDFEGVVLKGVGSDYDLSFFDEYLVEGKLPVFAEKRSKEVLLSEYIANRMQLKVGDEFNTLFLKQNTDRPPSIRVFEVVGIYNSGFQDFDENVMVGDLRQVQKLNNWDEDKVGGFEVYLEDFDQIKTKGNEIYEEIPSELNTQTITNKFSGMFEWIKLLDTNILIIIIIMIVVAGINMITALLVLILERTQMIGILKALGSSNWSIRKLFLYNASYIILRGLFWGNLIGISLLLIQKYFGVITLNPDTYYVKESPVYLNLGYIILLNLGTLVLCFLMMIVPSWIITRISPVKAIKFE